MNYTIETSIGIDAVIESVKSDLYNGLEDLFPSAQIDAFGRVYRNRKEVGLVPEYRINNEYRDVYLDDSRDLIFSFLPSEESDTEDEFVFVNEVKVLFFANLGRLYGDYVDAQAHRDMVSKLRAISNRRYNITTVEVGIENVLSDFYTEALKAADIAPWHFFAVGIRLYYNLNDSCNG